MSDLRRVSFAAVVLLVVLRISIGWQFIYEGLWKIDSSKTSRPWSAAGYLKNAQGPFRNRYRDLTGDPNDLEWLDYESMVLKWDAWQKRFVAHYPDLTKEQQRRLERLLNGPPAFYARLEKLPEEVKFGPTLSRAIKYEAERKRLVVDGKRHLTPRERAVLQKMVPVRKDPQGKLVGGSQLQRDFSKAVDDVYQRQSRLSYKEKLAAALKGDPQRVGVILEEQAGTIDHKRMGEIELYRKLLDRYERNLAKARQDFQFDHLRNQWREIQQLRVKLVGPVKALDAGLKDEARKLLSFKQLARGPVPAERTKIANINRLTIWALTGLGTLLIIGLGTRLAALAGAGMLLSFYLAMPPWPGVPDFREFPGPEHSYIVDKNLIEVFALLAIACLPTGSWFGIDGLFRRCFASRRASPRTTSSEPESVAQQTELGEKADQKTASASG